MYNYPSMSVFYNSLTYFNNSNPNISRRPSWETYLPYLRRRSVVWPNHFHVHHHSLRNSLRVICLLGFTSEIVDVICPKECDYVGSQWRTTDDHYISKCKTQQNLVITVMYNLYYSHSIFSISNLQTIP